jgi:3-oxoacyl-[acyl-carrier-protein] synthase II
MKRRVVITGMGAVTPIGLNVRESWQSVRQGVCGIGPIQSYDPAGQKVTLAAEVKNFDASALLGRQKAMRMARFTQLALAAAKEAMEDSCISTKPEESDR